MTLLPPPRCTARSPSPAHDLRADGSPWASALPPREPVRRAMFELPDLSAAERAALHGPDADHDARAMAESLFALALEGTP